MQTEVDAYGRYRSKYALRLLVFLLLIYLAYALCYALGGGRIMITYAALSGGAFCIICLLMTLIMRRNTGSETVTELRQVVCTKRVKKTDSEGDSIEVWHLSGYGEWKSKRRDFVSVVGTSWETASGCDNYCIALNQKGKLLRIFIADEFRIASM